MKEGEIKIMKIERYRLIKKYPGCHFKIGDIIEFADWEIENGHKEIYVKKDYDDYLYYYYMDIKKYPEF